VNPSPRPGSAVRYAIDFLGLNTNTSVLLLVIVLIAAGEETWMRFVPKYLEVLGASAFIIGAYDGLKTLLGAVYAWPGGIAVDRWGHRTALMSFTGISIVGYLVVLAVPHWAGVIAGTFLFLAWTTLSLPATFTLVAETLPARKHAMGIGVQSLVRRVPAIIGPIAGGVLIDRLGITAGVQVGLLISILLGSVAIWFQRRIAGSTKPVLDHQIGLWNSLKRSDARLIRLLWSDILIRLCERIPFAWVVIYAINDLGVSASEVGILIAIEMIAAIICYLPASWLADRYGKEPFVITTFLIFTAFPLTLYLSSGFPSLALAFAVRGLKEFGEPARKALIVSYAAAEARGRTVGAYYLIRDSIVSLGALVGAVLWQIGPVVNFWGAALVGGIGTAVYIATLRSGRRASLRFDEW
jgi:predicted MFS family arabinose efflux permease